MPAAPDFPPAPDRVKPQRALISLSDKAGLEDAARTLHDPVSYTHLTLPTILLV